MKERLKRAFVSGCHPFSESGNSHPEVLAVGFNAVFATANILHCGELCMPSARSLSNICDISWNKEGIMYVGVKADQVEHAYVVWVDVMGTKNIMLASPVRAANHILRLQGFAIEARKKIGNTSSIDLYPMNDGVFVVSSCSCKDSMKAFLRLMFRRLAENFLESDKKHKFLVRGAIACGKVFTHKVLSAGLEYKIDGKLLVGLPLIQAFQAEKKSPPFGLYVHESARDGFSYLWHEWWGKNYHEEQAVARKLFKGLNEYFEWAEKMSSRIPYPIDKIRRHKEMSEEYFGFSESI